LLQGGVGFAGVALCVAAMALLDDIKFLSDLTVPALLAFWILLGAPLVFKRLGWSEQDEEKREGLPLAMEMARR
jgi:hypothetical protein